MPRAPKLTPVAAPAVAPSAPHLYVGTSGWAYRTWKPGFYAPDIPASAFLHAYAAALTSVEVNFTFRSECTAPQIAEWLSATPPGFRFSFKAPQRITHFQRMRDSSEAVAAFIASLKPVRKAGKLGALLFQFPPNFKLQLDRLADFLKLAPLRDRKLQFAFEFRNPSWFCEDVYALLRKRNAALCIAESDSLVTPDVLTADHTYLRLRCNGAYTNRKLAALATRLAITAQTRTTYVYFKHEDEPTGAWNAVGLQQRAAGLQQRAARFEATAS